MVSNEVLNLTIDKVDSRSTDMYGAAGRVVVELVLVVVSPVGHSPHAIHKTSILIVISTIANNGSNIMNYH